MSGALTTFRTKAEVAYEHLRENITNGTFRPGQRLTLAEVSKVLALSQVPVREALLRLEHEGLVENEPHKGMRVARLSLIDAHELFEIRIELEGLAAFRACTADDAALTGELRALDKAFARALAESDFSAMGEANWAFHRRILRSAASGQLTRLLEDTWTRSFRFRLGYQLIEGRAKRTILEHKRIIEAIEARAPERAREAARQHIRIAGLELEAVLADEAES